MSMWQFIAVLCLVHLAASQLSQSFEENQLTPKFRFPFHARFNKAYHPAAPEVMHLPPPPSKKKSPTSPQFGPLQDFDETRPILHEDIPHQSLESSDSMFSNVEDLSDEQDMELDYPQDVHGEPQEWILDDSGHLDDN